METLKINGIVIDAVGGAVFGTTGVIADLHIGMEESLLLATRFQTKHMIKMLESFIKRHNLKKIVLNGDIKHGFGKDISQEWSEIAKLMEFLTKHVEVVVVKGNHDFYIQNMLSKYADVVDELRTKCCVVSHGHKKVEHKGKMLIIGNEHPALMLRDEIGSTVKVPCFLYFRVENILVLPAFNPLSRGSNVLSNDFLSPNLKNVDIQNAEVYAINQGEILSFGTIGDLRGLV